MNYDKIKELADIHRISIPQLAEKVGMTKRGLYACIENNSLKVETLEKIAEVLQVSISTFFTESIKSEESSTLEKRVKELEDQVAVLMRDIGMKDDMIAMQKEILRTNRFTMNMQTAILILLREAINIGNFVNAKFILETNMFMKLEGDEDEMNVAKFIEKMQALKVSQ